MIEMTQAAGAVSRAVLVGLALALLLLATYPRAAAARGAEVERPVGAGPREPTAQPTIPRSCAEIEGMAWGTGVRSLGQVLLEIPNLRPEWGDRSPSLCLMDDPDLDRRYAILLAVFRDMEEFRSTKDEAVRQLARVGFDPCQVDLWEPLAVLGRLDQEDLYGLPAECYPHAVARDHGAVAWAPYTRGAHAGVADR